MQKKKCIRKGVTEESRKKTQALFKSVPEILEKRGLIWKTLRSILYRKLTMGVRRMEEPWVVEVHGD